MRNKHTANKPSNHSGANTGQRELRTWSESMKDEKDLYLDWRQKTRNKGEMGHILKRQGCQNVSGKA